MRKLPAAVLSLSVLAACSDSALSPSGDLDVSASASVDRKVDVVVVLNGHAKGKSLENKQRAQSIARQMGLVPTFAYGAALTGFAAAVPEGRLRALEKDPRVQFISPDEGFSIEWQILPAGVDRVDADQSSTVAGDGTGSVNVGIAIIDTGIDPTHPDLNVAGGSIVSPTERPGTRADTELTLQALQQPSTTTSEWWVSRRDLPCMRFVFSTRMELRRLRGLFAESTG